jgi:O-methyltransferase
MIKKACWWVLVLLLALSSTYAEITTISFEFSGAPSALVYTMCGLTTFFSSYPSKSEIFIKLQLNNSAVHRTYIPWNIVLYMEADRECWTRSVEPDALPPGVSALQAFICSERNCDFNIMTSVEFVHIYQNPFKIEFLNANQSLGNVFCDSLQFISYPSKCTNPAIQDPSGPQSTFTTIGEGTCKPLLRYDTCFCGSLCEHSTEHLVSDPDFQSCAQSQQMPVLGIGACNFQRNGPSSPELERRFIELTKMSVLGLLHERWNGHIDGSLWQETSNACTLIGLRRMDHMQFLLEEVIRLNIPGDFIETGVWRGGASIFAAAVFLAYSQTCPSDSCRRVFLADSFCGIPPVNTDLYPVDAAHAGAEEIELFKDTSAQRVRDSFAAFGVLSDAVVFLEGWFKDTLPAARLTIFGRFSVIRLDGDTYEATWLALDQLYHLLSPGGFVIVDDFTDWIGCRKAVSDFREQHAVTSPIRPVFHGPGELVRGIWWQKH